MDRYTTEWENLYSSSWVTINWWVIAQPKTKWNFRRVTLRILDKTEGYGHLKTYWQNWGPHGWWINLWLLWKLGLLYINKDLLTIWISKLPDFWWLFDWDNSDAAHTSALYIVKS